jgi:hypothetical protein
VKHVLVLLALALTSCGLFGGNRPDAADAYNLAMALCEAYQFAPPKLRTENQDIACRQLKRICLDPSLPPLKAPVPAVGNKVVSVDAGVGGAGGARN